ncbi:MAG: M4 family metallopeptidase [Polyangiaceae bacterium]|nr:M4 family metallopeptidase [Polyangiaceae bacterium]
MKLVTRSSGTSRRGVRVAAVLALALGACVAEPGPDGQGGGGPTRSVAPAPLASGRKPRETGEQLAARAAAVVSPEDLAAVKADLGLGPRDDLRPVLVLAPGEAHGTVRYAHYHEGIRVIASFATVDTDGDAVTGVASNIHPDIAVTTTPAVEARQAVDVVRADPERFPDRVEPEVELAILPLTQQVVKRTGLPPGPGEVDLNADELETRVTGHKLVYVIDTDEEDRRAPDPMRVMRYLVDARTGEILAQRSRKSHATNQGLSMYAYPSSSSTFSKTVSLSTAWEAPWFDPTVYRYVMYDENDSYFVQDEDDWWWYGANNLYSGVWGDGLDFAGDASASTTNRQTAMVDAKFALQAVSQMFNNVYGEAAVFTGATCYMHHGTWYDDAFFSGGDIYVGDGPEGEVGTRTSLDTISHELGHAWDAQNASLLSCDNGEACGLSEANADIVAVMTNYYVYNLGLLNAATSIPDGNSSVDTGLNSIDYWNMFNGRKFRNPTYPYYFSGIGNQDEHDALGPMVAAFYFLAMGASTNTTSSTFSYLLPYGMDGIGIQKAARIWRHAMKFHLTSSTTYSTLDDALILSAQHEFGTTTPEQPEVIAVRNAMAGANFATRSASYEPPPYYDETGGAPHTTRSSFVYLMKPLEQYLPAGKPVRKEVIGNVGPRPEEQPLWGDWYRVSVPNGYALKISVVPTWGNDHELIVYEGNDVDPYYSSMEGPNVVEVVRVPYVDNEPSGSKTFDLVVFGADFATGNGNYRLYVDWVPFCSGAEADAQPFFYNATVNGVATTINGMVGCAGTVGFGSRDTLCGPGTYVCSAAQWKSRRGTGVPAHNYWTNDELKYSGTSSACSASLSTGTSCGANPMRVCSPTQTDPEGNNCNWTGCGLDSTSNSYFGGCVNNTTAGTLCCFE